MKEFILPIIATIIIAYLLGSVAFAVVVTKLFTGKDIRSMGSGNAGMTNVLRSVGKGAAIVTILGDFFKGTAAVCIGKYIFVHFTTLDFTYGMWIAALFAILGHLFPIYFRFKGGKGVSVAAGSAIVINPYVVAVLVVIFVGIIIVTKIVSLASVSIAVLYPIFTAFYTFRYGGNVVVNTSFALTFALLVIFMHRENIKRLLNGTEYKFGQKKG